MTVAVLIDNPAGSQEVYEQVRERLGIDETTGPAGGILHIAGPSPNGGWRVVELWESPEAAEAFAREKLAPIFAELGMPERPQPQVWPVHAVLQAK